MELDIMARFARLRPYLIRDESQGEEEKQRDEPNWTDFDNWNDAPVFQGRKGKEE